MPPENLVKIYISFLTFRLCPLAFLKIHNICTIIFCTAPGMLTISFFYFKVSVVEMDSRSMRILGVNDRAHTHSRKWQFTWKAKHVVSSTQSPGLNNSNMVSGPILKSCFLSLKIEFLQSKCEHASLTCAPNDIYVFVCFYRSNIYCTNRTHGGKQFAGLLKAVETARFTIFRLQNFPSASHLFRCFLRKISMNNRNAHPSLFKNTPILKYAADATTSCL